MRAGQKHIAAVVVALLLSCGPITISAGDITSRLLQYNQNRLYFGSGEEENVFAGSRYMIWCGEDSLLSGLIEYSHTGVSISAPIGELSVFPPFDSCRVIIQAAEPKPGAHIRFGTSLPLQSVAGLEGPSLIRAGSAQFDYMPWTAVEGTVEEMYRFEFLDDSILVQTNSADEDTSVLVRSLTIIPYDNDDAMLFDFEAGRLDGCISYHQLRTSTGSTMDQSGAAPYAVLLMPNLSRSVNQQGLLTTSLYYRFDHNRSWLCFEGDRVQPLYTLLSSDEKTDRVYAFDPEKGRSLFTRISGRPRALSIFADRRELEPVANYFADILSRDRCRASLVDDRSKADIYIEMAPIGSGGVVNSYQYIVEALSQDTVAGTASSATVRMAATQLKWAEESFDSDRKQQYLHLVERRLIDDLGLFPLLRPTVFLTTHKHIRGMRFESTGCLDLRQLRRVTLPDCNTGVTR